MTQLLLHLNEPLPEDIDRLQLAGLDGLVAPAATPSLDAARRGSYPPIIAWYGSLPDGCEAEASDAPPTWVVDAGLETCATWRDAQPDYDWLPRLTVYRQEVSYRMSQGSGDGFKFFAPDAATIHGYRVTDGDCLLLPALRRARALGFERLWLHARDAERRALGLDLALLERARAEYTEELWFSGGVSTPQHLTNLVRAGGVQAVVIDLALIRALGVAPLSAALTAPAASEQPASAPLVQGGQLRGAYASV